MVMRRSVFDRHATALSPRIMRVLGVLGLIVLLAACDAFNRLPWGTAPSPRACTAIGCESAVVFPVAIDLEVDIAYDVEACVDEVCERQVLRVPLPADGPYTGTAQGSISLYIDTDTITFTLGDRELRGNHRARLTVLRDGDPIIDDETDVEFARHQPNGPGCEPVCWSAEAIL
jgi:hypothetical protein